jgi:hypothetical protein
MGKKYTTTKTCIYCGAESGSEEHVFPDWLRKRYKGYGTLEHKVDIDSPIRFKRGVKYLTLTVRSVCNKCNKTWMKKIQDETKPVIERLLDSPSAPLDLGECRLLTTWAVMSTMCSETRNQQRYWRYTELDHTLFFTNREIPKNTDVWICYWANSQGPSYDGRAPWSRKERGFVATFGFGTLVFQVIHVVPVDPKDRETRNLVNGAPWDEILIPIRYPKDLPISWPPKKAIQGDPGIDALEARFVRTPVATHSRKELP